MYRRKQLFLLLGVMLAGGVSQSDAQLAPRKAEEWVITLEGPQRLATLKIDEVLARLSLKSGMTVADIGAGTGVFSRPLAKAVAPAGRVYAEYLKPAGRTAIIEMNANDPKRRTEISQSCC